MKCKFNSNIVQQYGYGVFRSRAIPQQSATINWQLLSFNRIIRTCLRKGNEELSKKERLALQSESQQLLNKIRHGILWLIWPICVTLNLFRKFFSCVFTNISKQKDKMEVFTLYIGYTTVHGDSLIG